MTRQKHLKPPPLPPLLQTQRQQLSLVQPSQRKKHRPRVFRVLRSVFPNFPHHNVPSMQDPRPLGGIAGKYSGNVGKQSYRNFIWTSVLQREMSTGMLRIALECEKRSDKDKTRVLDEPLWTTFCNGKKSGYGVKREASEEDLNVMELLKAVSMGAGVLPGTSEGPDGELAYMRAHFERVVGSKDSETLYMISPEGDTGPELSIFFVRV
ncbi:PROTEIN MIZU-KUSSEI 1 [Salix koriyanagi]|uniref:PROTEIN MIZU-KUSSEI 1 n=1 Tax=Salix koriyanagi TaxID=2511006 RepID=A0A9Q0P6K2_9ROSI|nr:PROTEIN MIZU-KUSSEI 1 [Salix koriyanagi]